MPKHAIFEPKSFFKVLFQACTGTILRSSIFDTEREREKKHTHCMFVFVVCLTCFLCQHAWFYMFFFSYDFLCLMLFNDCITLWENIKAVNFSPTSFQRDIASPRTRRKFQRHLPEWSPGNAAQRQESQSHTTLDTDLLGDDWWMRLARGVGYSAMWVCFLMGGWRCLKKNFCPI